MNYMFDNVLCTNCNGTLCRELNLGLSQSIKKKSYGNLKKKIILFKLY